MPKDRVPKTAQEKEQLKRFGTPCQGCGSKFHRVYAKCNSDCHDENDDTAAIEVCTDKCLVKCLHCNGWACSGDDPKYHNGCWGKCQECDQIICNVCENQEGYGEKDGYNYNDLNGTVFDSDLDELSSDEDESEIEKEERQRKRGLCKFKRINKTN
jgi:hypothetical protein